MYMVNFKKGFGISVILAAMLLSGCGESLSSENSNISSAQPAESSSAPVESSAVSSAQPEESSSLPEEPPYSEPPYSEPPDPYPADRVYPDDELVPSDWMRVSSLAEYAEKINETLSSSTSVKDPEKAVAVLIDRNLFFTCLLYLGNIFEVDWDAPYDSPDFERPIYPITSEYFSDIQTIYDLAYDTYEHSVADKILYGLDEPRWTEANGQMYINNTRLPLRGGCPPFIARSYIEITEKSESKCTFIWHYPDVEELNPPESGYEFFYYEKSYTAECIDGAWKLSQYVTDLN